MRNPENTPTPLIDRGALEQALRGDVRAVKAFRDALKAANDRLGERFRRNEAIEALVAGRAQVVDEVILASWIHFAEKVLGSADLVAVGGYGRGELHPQSDIDLLVLIQSASNAMDDAIGRFLTFLWDIGLEVGHSVRTLDDCETQAKSDVTVLTTLMETRLLHGPGALFAELPVRIAADRMWNSAEFFHAKLEEQRFSVVREYCGHGIGRVFHEDPQVLHYGQPGSREELVPGMTITVEPMVNAGKREVKLLSDGWTVVTKDHSLSAQWEHTVLVTPTGFEVLTLSPAASGRAA